MVVDVAGFMARFHLVLKRLKAKLDRLLLLRLAEKPTGSVGVMQGDLSCRGTNANQRPSQWLHGTGKRRPRNARQGSPPICAAGFRTISGFSARNS